VITWEKIYKRPSKYYCQVRVRRSVLRPEAAERQRCSSSRGGLLRELVQGTEELVAQEAQETHLSPKERVTPIVDVIRGDRLEEGVSLYPSREFEALLKNLAACSPAADPRSGRDTSMLRITHTNPRRGDKVASPVPRACIGILHSWRSYYLLPWQIDRLSYYLALAHNECAHCGLHQRLLAR